MHHSIFAPITISASIERCIELELPERYSTQRSYLAVLRRWIGPKWGEYLLGNVKAIAVEQWLRSLALAPKTKGHIRNLMHRLYENARRWELVDRNPIELVRQGGRRLSIPRVLQLEEVLRLLVELKEPYRTMVLVAACLGLRVSEIIGLQWGDFDWENRTVLAQRSVVHGRVGDTKTEYSQRPMPLDAALADAIWTWREQSMYPMESDWVFANDRGKPRWQETILEKQLKPAALSRYRQDWLAHFPSYLLDDVAVAGCRREGATRAVTSRGHSDNPEHLHSGRLGCEAGSEQQSCPHGLAGFRTSKKAALGGLALIGS